MHFPFGSIRAKIELKNIEGSVKKDIPHFRTGIKASMNVFWPYLGCGQSNFALT
jgi:hypothetical protein